MVLTISKIEIQSSDLLFSFIIITRTKMINLEKYKIYGSIYIFFLFLLFPSLLLMTTVLENQKQLNTRKSVLHVHNIFVFKKNSVQPAKKRTRKKRKKT